METNKKLNTDSSINNSNTNNITLNVTPEKPKRQYTKKKQEPNWYTRTILGGIIALVLSLCAYYIKSAMDEKADPNSNNITPEKSLVQPNN